MSQTPSVSRSSRQLCWESRDSYYACLTSHKILAPPGTDMSDTKGPLGRGGFAEKTSPEERARILAEQRASDPCAPQRDAYEKNCAQSWVRRYAHAGRLL